MKPKKLVSLPINMGRRSKGRRTAKRRLPDLLLRFRRQRDAVARRAKRPGLPRLVQRERRLAAVAKAKEAASKRRESLSERLGIGAKKAG